MRIDLVYMLLMLGHILGDFYFQSDKMAQERKDKYVAVAKHSLVYALTVAGVLFLGIPHCKNRTHLIISISVCHFIIDAVKYIIEKAPNNKLAKIKKYLLIIDQFIHFIALAVCWFFWGRKIDVRWFISQEMIHLPDLPITILLGILCVIKPIGIWIGDSNLRKYLQADAANNLYIGSSQNAGRTIGYLERIIVLIFLMYQQFGAIAFVLTAKSVARFKKIEKNQDVAEYYLIGTLMSVGSAMLVAVLLGLTQ